MPIITIENAALSFGTQVILDHVDFSLEPGERVCLIGRNGTGKSTLLKILDGSVHLDHGDVWLRPGMRVSRLEQELPQMTDTTIYNYVAEGLGRLGHLLAQFHDLVNLVTDDPSESNLDKLHQVQQKIEDQDGWLLQQRVESVLSRLGLPADLTMNSLSGGWRRRVALAKAIVNEPDLLLLDEPTNHLDLVTIEWLENQLKQFNGAIVFITHDRALVRALATRIIELDRGHLLSCSGNYDNYLEFKEHQLAVEEQHNALFDKRLAQEEVWIRQGIKARRTRNEGRVRALEALREERSRRREVIGKASFNVDSGAASGKLVAELQDVSFQYGGKTIISRFTSTILRGDRIGLIGANGVGKTTLLKIVLGELQPTQGSVKLGTKLQVAYFDQLRDQLDLERNVIDNVAGGRDSVTINGRDRHIYSYLSDFLFSPERSRTPVKALSGGERNRLLLAKLFSLPANLLVLDEPTNDLDMETLELLEQLLTEFDGTILVVSHDRRFIDNIVTSTFVFAGEGIIKEYVGGFEDWLRQGGKISLLSSTLESQANSVDASAVENLGEANITASSDLKILSKSEPVKSEPAKTKKLPYKLQRELEALPGQIDALEKELESIKSAMASPDFYNRDHQLVADTIALLAAKEAVLESYYARWSELDG